MGKPGLLHLPTEILVAIIQILDLRDAVAMLQICRTLYNIINDTQALQYKLELESNAMVDDQSSTLPTARRIELLRRQNKVWHEWTPATDFKQSNGRLPTYDFQKGILSIGKSTDDSSMTRAVEFHRLRSTATDSPHTLWSCNDLEVDVKDFTTDPEQDLIVLLERPVPLSTAPGSEFDGRGIYKLHFRTMSASAGVLPPHPRAAFPVLSVQVGMEDGFITDAMLNNGTLFLRGNLFAFVHAARRRHSGTGKTELWIWDWLTGKLVHEYSLEEEAAFTFLDDFSYLLVGHVNMRWRTTSWHIEIHTGDQSSAPIPRFDKVVTMALPDLASQCEIFGVSARSDPNDSDSGAIAFTEPPPLSNRLPFKPSNNRLVAITFSATRGGLFNANSFRFTVFMLTSQLLQLVAERLRGNQPNPIPWNEWGSNYTRWSHGLFPNAVVCNLQGLRYLTLANTRLSRLSIMDFNIYSIRKDSTSPNKSPHDPWEDKMPRVATRLVTEPTYTSVPQIFPEPIVSCLPYREITIPSLTIERDSGLMMDDQRVVVFESLTRDTTSFTVYTL